MDIFATSTIQMHLTRRASHHNSAGSESTRRNEWLERDFLKNGEGLVQSLD